MIEIKALIERFNGARGPVDAVRNVNLTIRKGAIFGRSRCGQEHTGAYPQSVEPPYFRQYHRRWQGHER